MKKTTTNMLILVLLMAMVPMGTSAATSVNLFGANDLISYDTPSLIAEPLAGDDLTASSLTPYTPFWADLVDTENVANDGEGVYVAVLDTGLLADWPFLFSDANVADDLGIGFTHDIWYDPGVGDLVAGPLVPTSFVTEYASGHGTHVASTIVGYNYGGFAWIEGVAPAATIIPVRVLDAWIVSTPDGLVGLSGGFDDMISAGIMYVADLSETLDGPVIINMSLGGPSPSPMIEAAIDYAISKGVIVVASAGNEGEDGMGYPGAFPQVISAAAAGWSTMLNYGWTADAPEDFNTHDVNGNNHQLYLEDFSSRPNKDLGQKHQDLDVATPGAWIVGPYKPNFSSPFGYSYYYLSGTSMAAPHVSAIAALVAQSYPDLGQAEMEFILKLAARGNPLPASDAIVTYPYDEVGYYTASWDGGDYGAGFLQADQALATAMVHA
jgi:subtilisin family serine protease